MSTRSRATLLGTGAIGLWSGLALLTAATGAVPPFQLAAMTFAIGGALGALTWIVRPAGVAALRQPPAVWALGLAGLFGYHALYFAALRLAPPAEAGLVSYLWPLLIVLLSARLPDEGRLPGEGGLRPAHLLGALMGFAGVVALFLGRGTGIDAGAGPGAGTGHFAGYVAALACAVLWSGYSVLSRRVGAVPTDAVAGFCLATAALSTLCHLTFEETVWPRGPGGWLAVVGLGLGPVGAAFYLWDVGVKRGDIRLLGVLSYAAPVLSTLILVAAGYAAATPALGLACALIAGGALIAARPGLGRPG